MSQCGLGGERQTCLCTEGGTRRLPWGQRRRARQRAGGTMQGRGRVLPQQTRGNRAWGTQDSGREHYPCSVACVPSVRVCVCVCACPFERTLRRLSVDSVLCVRCVCGCATTYHSVLLNERKRICLLYTSDAADDLLCVDLGGRR